MGHNLDAMLQEEEEEEEPSSSKIPMDLFVSKKHGNLPRGHLGFADSSGNILYQIPNSPKNRSFLVGDAAQKPIISVHRNPKKKNASWDGCSGNGDEGLLFTVQRTLHRLARTELEVLLAGQSENVSDFKVKGCPFQRSCTIYKGDSIVAQTSLMHNLRQLFVSRSRFRLTIYPGFADHAFIVALIVIFLDG